MLQLLLEITKEMTHFGGKPHKECMVSEADSMAAHNRHYTSPGK